MIYLVPSLDIGSSADRCSMAEGRRQSDLQQRPSAPKLNASQEWKATGFGFRWTEILW